MSTQGFPGGGVYRIVLFGFVGADRAAEVMAELEAGQELAGHSIVAHAVVERDARGEVRVQAAVAAQVAQAAGGTKSSTDLPG